MDISVKKLELIELLLHTQKEAVLDQVGIILKNQVEMPLNIPVVNSALRTEFLNAVENPQNKVENKQGEIQNDEKKPVILNKGHFQNNLNRKNKK